MVDNQQDDVFPPRQTEQRRPDERSFEQVERLIGLSSGQPLQRSFAVVVGHVLERDDRQPVGESRDKPLGRGPVVEDEHPAEDLVPLDHVVDAPLEPLHVEVTAQANGDRDVVGPGFRIPLHFLPHRLLGERQRDDVGARGSVGHRTLVRHARFADEHAGQRRQRRSRTTDCPMQRGQLVIVRSIQGVERESGRHDAAPDDEEIQEGVEQDNLCRMTEERLARMLVNVRRSHGWDSLATMSSSRSSWTHPIPPAIPHTLAHPFQLADRSRGRASPSQY